MVKPKLLLTGGWGWAATSPLIYTLQRNAKYAHFGYTKAFRYLEPYFKLGRGTRILFDFGGDDSPLQTKTVRSVQIGRKASGQVSEIYRRVCEGTWENWDSEKPSSHKMNTTRDYETIRDFPLDHFHKLMNGIPTISKYMDFYHALHDHVVSKGFKSVGDGYSFTRSLSPYITKFYNTMQSEFDVKQIMIARDPIRRAFSQYLCERQKVIDDPYKKDWRMTLVSPTELRFPEYVEKIKEANSVFGKDNVHTVVMEELWLDDGLSKKQLSDFLDFPITDLWKNLYTPDKGHFVKYDKDVPCQAYGQNLQELTPELYYFYKKKYQHIYDQWEDYFGYLPQYWGQPLKYPSAHTL